MWDASAGMIGAGCEGISTHMLMCDVLPASSFVGFAMLLRFTNKFYIDVVMSVPRHTVIRHKPGDTCVNTQAYDGYVLF